ncbi:low molecular weight protein-tyrosine-phosphatase [Actinomyces bovis]|nr:low molecular weight protein-tyrosine-phosphatase [Actinomyces bovis]
MVCTGNICRSAMAEMVLTDRLLAAGVPLSGPKGVVVTSAGVSAEETGNPMDSRALRLLAERGYGQGADQPARLLAQRLSHHRAHRISDAELRQADLLLAMTASHQRELRRRCESLGLDPERVRMFRHYEPSEPQQAASPEATAARGLDAARGLGAGGGLDVPDPWYGTMADFVDTLQVVERVSEALCPRLEQLGAEPPKPS